MNAINKKSNKLIIPSVFLVGSIIICIIYYLYDEVINLRIRTEHLESRLTEVITENLINISSSELEFYTGITDSAISRISSVTGIMGAAATLFGIIGVLFTLISYSNNKELKDRFETQQSQLVKTIALYKSELVEMQITQHILYADKHRKSRKYNYAINEYLKAEELDKDDYKIQYELGTLFADDYASYYEERTFNKAREYLIKAKNNCEKRNQDNDFLSDRCLSR